MVTTKTKKRGGGLNLFSSPKQTLPDNCVVFKDHLEILVKEYEDFKSKISVKDADIMKAADDAVKTAADVAEATRKTANSDDKLNAMKLNAEELNKANVARTEINKKLLDIWLESNSNSKISYYFQMPNNESGDGKYITFKIIKITKIIKEVVAGNIFASDKITYNLTGEEYYPNSSDGPKTINIPGNKNDKMMNAIIKIYKDKPNDISKALTVGGHTMRRKYRRKSTKKLAKSRRKIGMRKSVSK